MENFWRRRAGFDPAIGRQQQEVCRPRHHHGHRGNFRRGFDQTSDSFSPQNQTRSFNAYQYGPQQAAPQYTPQYSPYQYGPQQQYTQPQFQQPTQTQPSLQPTVDPQVQAAVDNATVILNGDQTDLGATQIGTNGTILSDAADVNGAADTDPSSARYQQAAAAVAQNQGLVANALAQLGPDAQAQYQQLDAQLQGDPVSQLAAQSLLLSGQMAQTDAAGGSLLGTLSNVSSANLAQGVDPQAFVRQLTKECATPGAINQGGTEDCTSTQASVLMDRLDPAEYARLATSAASPDGTVTWADGSQTQRQGMPDLSTGQSLPQAFLSNVAQQAEGANAQGADASMLGGLMSKMFNRQYSSQSLDANDVNGSQASMMNIISTSSNNGAPVSAAIELTDSNGNGLGAHEVLVNSVSNGQVQFTNPWGDEEQMSLADFQARLVSTTYAPSSVYSGMSAGALSLQQRYSMTV
jgi:hypothetical protein